MQTSTGIKHKIMGLFWLKIPISRAKFVTTISQASKDEIVKYSGCDPGKITVIPIALSPVYHYVARSYNWEKPTILIIGTAPNKNLKRMFLALSGISCKVLMIGKPEESVREMMKENNLEFEYLTGLSSEQMAEKYRQSDMLVFASLYEGFGMPIIEAQATGLPVVTSNISSMPEVAGEEGAVLVDPYDVNSIRQGIQSIMLDAQLRERLILNGFENVKRFSPQVISNMYYKLYQSI
jgi:glycosyltransferase involved in cell wall biosynthesis